MCKSIYNAPKIDRIERNKLVVNQLNQRFLEWTRDRLTAPPLDLPAAKQQVFEELLASASQSETNNLIPYTCPYPKHEFLRYMVDHHQFLLHGSRNPAISRFEPIRYSSDTNAFGQQDAVYAASDGIWPIVFAILDRQVYRGMFYNECSRVLLDQQLSDPFYMFAIEAAALRQQPWINGMVYLLPRDTFVPRDPSTEAGLTVYCQEWASHVPVQPLAKVAVEPQDFPFLHEVWGFDKDVLFAQFGRYPELWPFGELTDDALYPIRPGYWQTRQ